VNRDVCGACLLVVQGGELLREQFMRCRDEHLAYGCVGIVAEFNSALGAAVAARPQSTVRPRNFRRYESTTGNDARLLSIR
jgi:hypothetical protein